MATLIKTTAGTWKAIIRKRGWPSTFKNFRTKRDAQDWARRTEDEMVRGVYINRADAERITLAIALKRYSEEVTVTKSSTTTKPERNKIMTTLLKSAGVDSLSEVPFEASSPIAPGAPSDLGSNAPDPGVAALAKRRQFSPAQKHRILDAQLATPRSGRSAR